MDSLKEHPQIIELLNTLDKNSLTKEKIEVQSLVDYIGDMEETMIGMLGELQDMRREINMIHSSSLKSKCQSLVQKTESKIQNGFFAVKKMKDNLIQSAANAIQTFREKGKDALAESVRAIKIPETLDKLSSLFCKLSQEMAQDKIKLSSMQSELQSAKGHLKNIGLLFIGKATKEAEHKNTDKGILSRISRWFDKVQKGFSSLDQKAMNAADKLRVSRVKTSVKENLSIYKAQEAKQKKTNHTELTASKDESLAAQADKQKHFLQPKKTEKLKER